MASNGGRRPPLVAERRTKAAPARKRGATPPNSPRKKRAPRRAARARKGPIGWLIGLFTGVLRLIWRVVWGVGWRISLAFGLIIGAAVLWYAAQLPPPEALVDGRARGSVTMLDNRGEVFAWRGQQFGGMITAETVSVHLRNAVVATEDRRFYWHIGVDPQGIASAIRINLAEGRGPLEGNGGSTITQQTAKLLCLGRPYDAGEWENERAYEDDCRRTTLWRKAKEAVYSMAMELRYTKAEILTIYLNRVYLGAGARGFEAAAQRYFGISSAQVTPAQAAMLAGLLKAPSSYAPTGNLQGAQQRANVVIGLMREQGYLSASAATEAREHPAVLSEAAAAQAGGYFADWVMDSGPEFFTRDTTEDVIIRTTLDPRIQSAAAAAMETVYAQKVTEGSQAQAAIVVMSADGAVRAMVGGRDTSVAGVFNRATQALRQTGSAFKPFVYAAALNLGGSPLDEIDDSPITLDIPGSGPWTPRNYDNEFEGTITLLQALRESRNIPTVRLSERVGRENVRQVAEGFGISSDLALGPALALGASESTLIEMTGAYAGILNGGSSVTPYGLIDLRFQGESAPIMEMSSGIGERVIHQTAARQLIWMMHDVVEHGTGRAARIDGWELAGKTGTSTAARDAWFIGFSADYVVGVWMGYDDNTPLTGVTGSGLPADIWHETMVRVLAGESPIPLPMDPPSPSTNTSAEAIDSTLDQILSGDGGGGGDGTTPAPAPAPAPAPSEGDAINNALNSILNGG